MPAVELAFGFELLEHFGLIGLGLHLRAGQGDNDAFAGLLPGGDIQCFAEFVAVFGGPVKRLFEVNRAAARW